MKIFLYLSKLLGNITSLAKIAPYLALDVIVALFFGYGLHELLAVSQQDKYTFSIFAAITTIFLVIFTIVVLITYQDG